MNIIKPPQAFPPFQRVMAFIDGENLVCSYQRMLQHRTPRPEVSHRKDTYVWAPESILVQGLFEIIRASYYTYTTGQHMVAVNEVSNELKRLQFKRHYQSGLPNYLYPVVYWKSKGTRNGKGVDIQLALDGVTHTHEGNLDILYLVSGDGDFKPLIQEAIRKGKQVYVAALSDGLNESLKNAADVFVSLDEHYFEKA